MKHFIECIVFLIVFFIGILLGEYSGKKKAEKDYIPIVNASLQRASNAEFYLVELHKLSINAATKHLADEIARCQLHSGTWEFIWRDPQGLTYYSSSTNLP